VSPGGEGGGGLVRVLDHRPDLDPLGRAMVLARHAVHSAMFLIVNFFTLAVFFLILGSPFLFVVQIIVYAGAIMVLFLFVIMLLGVDRGSRSANASAVSGSWRSCWGRRDRRAVVAIRLGVGLSQGKVPDFTQANAGGNVYALARCCSDPTSSPSR
jgi:NADH-quinone oxidoreductase subunit J